jgi:hypothetical protein
MWGALGRNLGLVQDQENQPPVPGLAAVNGGLIIANWQDQTESMQIRRGRSTSSDDQMPGSGRQLAKCLVLGNYTKPSRRGPEILTQKHKKQCQQNCSFLAEKLEFVSTLWAVFFVVLVVFQFWGSFVGSFFPNCWAVFLSFPFVFFKFSGSFFQIYGSFFSFPEMFFFVFGNDTITEGFLL